jgi:ABC-type dipeptide/oligopeptide/nickel transport system permease component
VTTIAGTMFAGLMGGVVITETVFNRPGLGRFAASAATQLDIPSVLGFALFNGILFVLMNLIVDLLYAYFDPRVRLE